MYRSGSHSSSASWCSTVCTTKHPIPRRPLPVCIQCRLQTTPLLCQPRSSRRASISSQQLQSAGFFCGRPCDMKLVIRQSERPGHQQTPSDIHWKRFYFQLTCVHSTSELSRRCALQIYLLILHPSTWYPTLGVCRLRSRSRCLQHQLLFRFFC